jgi:hypothetical protein
MSPARAWDDSHDEALPPVGAHSPAPGLSSSALAIKGADGVATRPAEPALDREPPRVSDAPDAATDGAAARLSRGEEDAMDMTTEAYVDGLDAGFERGRAVEHEGAFTEGYSAGFDSGLEIGGARALAGLVGVLGREVVDALVAQEDERTSHLLGWADYRRRTTYTQPAGRREWRGLDNGDQLDGIRAEWAWQCRPARRAAADDGTEAGS